MVGDIKSWLKDHKYKYCVFPTLGSKMGKAVTVGIPLNELAVFQCCEIFTQLDKWVARGASGFELIEVDNVIYATFNAPLDTIYTLTLTVNGVKHFVHSTTGYDDARGVMLDRFIRARNGKGIFIHLATIDTDEAHIKCMDKETGTELSFDWNIVAKTTPFCG